MIKIHGSLYLIGFPDYMAMRQYRELVFVETKTKSGRTTKIQKRVHQIIEATGFKVEIVRDSTRETIENIMNSARG